MRENIRYALTVFTEVAQLFKEFLTSFAVGGFAGVRGRGEATFATGAADAAFCAEVVVAAKDALAKSKTTRVSGCISKDS